MFESGTPQKIGEINRRLIFDYIRKYGPISRADIHRNLNISAPAVSANVKKMIDAGYIVEIGDGDSSIGRKPTLLKFNSQKAYVIGIDVGRSQMRACLADLEGNEIAYAEEDRVIINDNAESLLDELCMLLKRLAENIEMYEEKICCITIGIPGVPNIQESITCAAPFIHIPDLNSIVDRVSSLFPQASIQIGNSVNYGAVGEKWKGAASNNYKNIVYVSYGVGIGAAIILNGELFTGTNGAAGEIGYYVPESVYLRESYSDEGVLETLISGKYVGDVLKQREGTDATYITMGEEELVLDRTLYSIINYIGMAFINLTAAFNEEVIVLGGRFGEFLSSKYIEVWKKMLERHVPFVPEIKVSTLKSRAAVMGAVAVAIRYANDECLSVECDLGIE